MKAEVKYMNPKRGMVAVLTEDEDFSVFELLGDELEIGDIVEWKGEHPLGGEDIVNLSKKENIRVFFENHCVPKAQLGQQLLIEQR